MRTRCLQFGVLLAVLLLPGALRAEVIDRILATVNGVPILQSDLEDALRYEAFVQLRSSEAFTPAERNATLDRLIDQELLRQQMPREFKPTESEVGGQMAEIRKQTGTAGSDEAWRKLLNGYGVDEALVRERVAAQIGVMQFVHLRLRPTVRIDAEAVESYYRETLVPNLEKMGAKVDPLSAVAPKIQELLAQRRIDEMLTIWLANLRSQSSVQFTEAAPSPRSVGQSLTSRIEANGK